MALYDSVHPKVAEHFRGYPLERLWYLIFDYNRRFMGPAGFDQPSPEDIQARGAQGRTEHEKGYMSSMFSGLNYVLATIDEPLSIEYLQELHDAAVSKSMRETLRGGVMKEEPIHERGYRETYGRYISVGLTGEGVRRNVTLAGLRELRNRIRNGDNYFRILFQEDIPKVNMDVLSFGEKPIPDDLDKKEISDEEMYNMIREGKNEHDLYTIRFGCDPKEMFNRLETIINEFNQSIADPGISDDEKIKIIAICVQNILLTHPFLDGNGRTMSLLLNKLLLQHNLSPTIIENPTMIDAFSVAELCEEIKKGQDVFRAQKSKPFFPDQEVQETGISVMYLKDNPYVAALLVHAAADCLTSWSRTNIGDRKRTVDLLVNDLCANSPELNATRLNEKAQEITEKIFNSTYKKGRFEFLSNGNMASEVMGSVSHANFGQAAHMIFGGNQYGIDFAKLEHGNKKKDTLSPDGPSFRQ